MDKAFFIDLNRILLYTYTMYLKIDTSNKPKNTAGLIADALRTAILQGKLTSKQHLKQDEIATEAGVSKIPVREALLQLEAEGLVTFYPNRGAIVSELSIEEIEEIYIMRIALETVTLSRAIPHLISSDLARAEGILNTIDQETDPMRWSQLNWEFHATLYQPANHPRLMQTVENLHANVARYLIIYRNMKYSIDSQREHREILAACRHRDIELARASLESHLKASESALVSFLKSK